MDEIKDMIQRVKSEGVNFGSPEVDKILSFDSLSKEAREVKMLTLISFIKDK